MKAVMRKGFFRIIEVVIVAVLVFITLTQLYAVPKANQPWATTKLSVMSQDLLYSMDAKGVNWFDPVEVNRTLSDILPKTVGYAVSVEQDVRPQMKIGAVCSPANCALLTPIFADFTLNTIFRNFTLICIPPGVFDLTLGAQNQTDAILICGSQSLTQAQITSAERYLSDGKGIVEISDLKDTDVVGSRWYNEVMNLRWVSDSLNLAPSGRTFFPYMDPDERRYPVKKIFYGIPPSLPSFGNFSNFGSATETVYPADDASEKIVVSQDTYYVGGSIAGAPVPLSMLDWGVNGSGRVAWMSNTSISGATDDENSAKKLLKSLVIWAASGRKYDVVEGAASTSATASMRKAYGGSGGSMYEAVRVYLTIGYNF
jgi:hypothetical protein